MPDDAVQPAAPQPAPEAAGQPAQQTQNDNQTGQGQSAQNTGTQYSPEDIAKWQRGYEQYNGSRSMLEQLGKAGIRSPEDFRSFAERAQKYDQLGQTLGQHRLDPDTLTKMFSGQQQAQPTEQQASSDALTLDSVRQVVGDELRSIELKRQHDQHQSAEKSAMDEAISGIVGENSALKQPASELFKMAVAAKMQSDPPLYPEDHPLANSAYRPLNKSEIQKIADEVGTMLQSIRGQDAVNQARQALNGAPNRPDVPATAGGGRSDDPNDLPFMLRSEQDQLALAKQVVDQRRASSSTVPQPMR